MADKSVFEYARIAAENEDRLLEFFEKLEASSRSAPTAGQDQPTLREEDAGCVG
ncbi:MAG: hypothetical protein Q7N50_09230 [Armatimonadota bacterium]|nr:hypothetical protein [Armatimonadota bacterium]